MPLPRRLLIFALALAGLLVAPAAATAWAPADSASITPGVQTYTEGSGQCTSNFIFTAGSDVLIGQSAHCAGTGAATETDGCEAGSQGIGTRVEIEGASRPGTLAYSSWLAMQGAGESDSETCAYNDFALVRIHPDDVSDVNPSVPLFGGPEGVGTARAGEEVYTYGNSSLRLGVELLKPKNGFVIDRSPGGWSYDLYTVTPGIPGDSGSAFLNSNGEALGSLSTLALAPLPASNGVTDIGSAIEYARAHGFGDLRLEDGTEPFRPSLLGLTG